MPNAFPTRYPHDVAHGLLGRTNQAFPPVWLSLATPLIPTESGWHERLAYAAREASTVIDISTNPGLWGGPLRGTDSLLMNVGGQEVEAAVDEKHAADLVQAYLIETLCAIGREHIDFFFLRSRRALEEYQINGALQALESARAEGHIRFVGLACEGPALAALGLWQFHDAFEVALIPRNHLDPSTYETLKPLAEERRAGIVTSKPLDWGNGRPFTSMTDAEGPLPITDTARLRNLTQGFYGLSLDQAVVADLAEDHPVLVSVRSPQEIAAAIEAPHKKCPEGLNALLEPFREAYLAGVGQ